MKELNSLTKVFNMPMSAIEELSIKEIKQIGEDLNYLSSKITLAKQCWVGAIARKYEAIIKQIRQEIGKDTGIIHVSDGEFDITEDRPKKIDWDQSKLATIAKRIEAGGGNTSEYIDIKYSILESKYNAWPDDLKASFNDARTLMAGKPTFKVTLKG